MIPNTAKRSLSEGKSLFGCWLQLFNPIVAEMMGLSGYDAVMLDMEHGLGSAQDAANIMRAARGTGAASLVRLPVESMYDVPFGISFQSSTTRRVSALAAVSPPRAESYRCPLTSM